MLIMQKITLICAGLAALMFFSTLMLANGAPQEAAGMAMAIALTLIPYCVTSTLQRAAILKALKPEED
jgi:uncharacterized membrane protein YdfJ with MMPL/SSD domain